MKKVKMIFDLVRMILRKNGVERVEFLEMFREIFVRHVYNPKGFEINEHDVVVDIGANVGVFTIFAAAKTKNKVYAYEPFLENVEVLRQNTKDLRQVICFGKAVSSKAGREKLYLDGDYKVGILFDRNIHGKLKKFVWVKTTTLKKVFEDNNLKRIDFLKIDAEGSEGGILKSTPDTYLKKINKIALEFHNNVSLLKHEEIIKLLNKTGFVTRLKWQKGSLFGYIYAKMVAYE